MSSALHAVIGDVSKQEQQQKFFELRIVGPARTGKLLLCV